MGFLGFEPQPPGYEGAKVYVGVSFFPGPPKMVPLVLTTAVSPSFGRMFLPEVPRRGGGRGAHEDLRAAGRGGEGHRASGKHRAAGAFLYGCGQNPVPKGTLLHVVFFFRAPKETHYVLLAKQNTLI